MAAMAKLSENELFTYADYLTWPDGERWELIDGEAYMMSPAPSRKHQEISIELASQFHVFLKGKPCRVYDAPFDVRLPQHADQPDDEIETVVQPDIVVVCDRSKLDDKGCKGAPDLVIEILSPSTSKMDMQNKFFLYQRVGVKEYWLVHPFDKTVMVFRRNDQNEFGRAEMYASDDRVSVPLLGELIIDLKDVFSEQG